MPSEHTNLSFLRRLIYNAHDRRTFESAKQILLSVRDISHDEWEHLLETIGTEESFQRCCDKDHACENILYAIYEMALRASNGEPFSDIGCWEDAIGLTVDGCFGCADTSPTLTPTENGRYLITDRLVLCTGNTGIVVEANPNVYLCPRPEALERNKRSDLSALLPFCINATITNVSFEHNEVTKEMGVHRQPVILLSFDNGAQLRFSTNFGEVDKSEGSAYLQFSPPID